MFGEGDIVLYRNIDKFFPIRKQMIFVIIFAFVTCSGFLYTSMTLVEVFLDKVIFSDENLEKTKQEYILKIQNFIDENNINTKNLHQLYEWNSNHKNIFLRLYEDNELIYDSRVGIIDEKIYINNQYKKGNINKYSILSFKDKNLVARIIAIPNYIVNQTIYHLMVFISFCIFLFIILKCTNKKIRYLELIKKQLEEDEKIDIKGNDEITHVANAINIMLDCLNEKMESERIIYKGNMELITSLSHDIRTPLTSLIGYQELALERNLDKKTEKYIRMSYDKALYLREITNRLFDHFLLISENDNFNMERVNSDEFIAHFIEERLLNLEEQGVIIERNIQNITSELIINVGLMQRLFENIFSNIEKYAELNRPINLEYKINNGFLVISFVNHIKDRNWNVVSSKIGLKNCNGIMKVHSGFLQVEKTEVFKITVSFPIIGENININ